MIKLIMSIFLCTFIVACSSKNENAHYEIIENNYYHGYVKDNYTQTQFTTFTHKSVKKPAYSDHQLMMSLLNRPMTADQAMMIAFEQERASYYPYYGDFSVKIKGEKSSDELTNSSGNAYSKLISQDLNAVNIQAPY